jgi:hypothetical protein
MATVDGCLPEPANILMSPELSDIPSPVLIVKSPDRALSALPVARSKGPVGFGSSLLTVEMLIKEDPDICTLPPEDVEATPALIVILPPSLKLWPPSREIDPIELLSLAILIPEPEDNRMSPVTPETMFPLAMRIVPLDIVLSMGLTPEEDFIVTDPVEPVLLDPDENRTLPPVPVFESPPEIETKPPSE